MHHYQLFGLSLASEIPLPELDPAARADPADAPDLTIRQAELTRPEGEQPGIAMRGARDAHLYIPDVGRYRMRDGTEMLFEPLHGASLRNVRLFLLGSAMAAILHQRALLPLHANAVVLDGKAVAFMGHPGAGKSTLAAWFHDRGARILSDDVCVVDPAAAPRPRAWPGIPRLRLWREALEATGRDADAYELSFDDMDKYNVPTAGAGGGEAVELSHVYVLEKAAGPDAPAGIDGLTGTPAVDALVANTYRGAYLPLMGEAGRHLFQCVELSRKAKLFTARRRWGYRDFDREAEALEAHARRVIAQS